MTFDDAPLLRRDQKDEPDGVTVNGNGVWRTRRRTLSERVSPRYQNVAIELAHGGTSVPTSRAITTAASILGRLDAA